MGRNLSIHQALEAHVGEFSPAAPLDSTPIQYRSFGISEPETGPWVEIAILGENGRPLDKAGSATDRRGYIQFTTTQRIGDVDASANLLSLADQIEDHFPKGLRLSAGGLVVKVSRDPEMQSEFPDNGRLRRPVVVYWQAIA